VRLKKLAKGRKTEEIIMAKNSIPSWVPILLVLVIIGFAAGWIPYSQGPVADGTTIQEGYCPDTGLVDIRLAAFNDLNTNDAMVATNAVIFLTGDSTSTETVTTTTSAYNSTSTDIACGTDYFIVYGLGDETNYYESWIEGLNTGDSATNTHKYAVDATGSISILGANTTNFGVSTGVNIFLGSGEDNSDVVLTLKENTADALFGQGAVMLCMDYDVLNFSSVEAVGGTSVAVPTVVSGREKCWRMDMDLVDFGSQEVTIFVDTQAAVNPALANITITVLDYQNFEYLGEKYFTVEDPADNTVIGATDGTYIIYTQ